MLQHIYTIPMQEKCIILTDSREKERLDEGSDTNDLYRAELNYVGYINLGR